MKLTCHHDPSRWVRSPNQTFITQPQQTFTHTKNEDEQGHCEWKRLNNRQYLPFHKTEWAVVDGQA